MGLEEQFKENLKEWKKYCESKEHMSSIRTYLNCDSYRTLVVVGQSMKNEMLELIRKNIDDIPIQGLAHLVKSIVGEDYNPPIEKNGFTKFDFKKIKHYTVMWLEAKSVLRE